jgi:hypothetical protein
VVALTALTIVYLYFLSQINTAEQEYQFHGPYESRNNITGVNRLESQTIDAVLLTEVQNKVTTLGVQQSDLDLNQHSLECDTLHAKTIQGTMRDAVQDQITSLGTLTTELNLGAHNVVAAGSITADNVSGTLRTDEHTGIAGVATPFPQSLDLGSHDVKAVQRVTAQEVTGTLLHTDQHITHVGQLTSDTDLNHHALWVGKHTVSQLCYVDALGGAIHTQLFDVYANNLDVLSFAAFQNHTDSVLSIYTYRGSHFYLPHMSLVIIQSLPGSTIDWAGEQAYPFLFCVTRDTEIGTLDQNGVPFSARLRESYDMEDILASVECNGVSPMTQQLFYAGILPAGYFNFHVDTAMASVYMNIRIILPYG